VDRAGLPLSLDRKLQGHNGGGRQQVTASVEGAWRRWGLAAVLLLAFGLRLVRFGAQSLSYDETVSVYLASESLPALVAHTAGDIHPPGYYILLHVWTRLAGSSGFAAAFPSLFFGLLLAVLANWLGSRVFGPASGLLAALLVAISPYNLWYSQEVRMYTLAAALGMGLLGALLPLLASRPGSALPWTWLAVYVLCGALGLWMLYYFAFLLLAVNLMVGVWWLAGWQRRRTGWDWLGRWSLAQGAVVLLYLPWISVAWRQATEPPVPPWRSFTGLGRILMESWSALSLGQSVEPLRVWPVLLGFGTLFGLGLLFGQLSGRSRDGARRGLPWLLAGALSLPVLLIYLASYLTPLYHVRYVFTYSTPFYILVAAGLAWLRQRWRPALWFGLAVIVAFSGISIRAYYADPLYANDDHRAATRFLAERWRPGDAILVNAGYAYTALLTYWDGEPIGWHGRLVGDSVVDSVSDLGQVAHGQPLVFETGTVDGGASLGWGDPGSDFYAMSWPDTSHALGDLFAAFDRVWVYRIYDTVTDPAGLIRRWLDEHGTPFEDQVFTGESQLRVQGFLTGRDPLADGGRPLDAALADGSLRLLAVEGGQQTVPVGGALDVPLVWQVGSPAGDDWILFAGLFDEDGRRWAQADERPLGSLFPPAAWPRGATLRTPLQVLVPAGTPPGPYRLEVGWYHFVDGQPLWLPWTAGDRLDLGEVEVVAPADWWALPSPVVAHPLDVTIGQGVRLLGFDAPLLQAEPGETLPIDLFWQALQDRPEPGPAVLQLADDAGHVRASSSSAPVGGRAAFVALEAGQVVRDPRSLTVPATLAPGVYDLLVGRQRPDGIWLPVRRGLWALGPTYPLATVRVLDPPLEPAP
jgi:mannosyltransferase